MNIKYILLALLTLCGVISYSQSAKSIMDKLSIQPDISAVSNRINQLLKKDSYFSKMEGLKCYHTLLLNYQGEIRQEDFLNHTFLNKLSPAYFSRRVLFWNKKYLSTLVLICDSTGKLVATSNGRLISNLKNNVTISQMYLDLASVFVRNEMDYIFYIYSTSASIFWGIKDQNIYGLKSSKSGLEIFPFDDFVKCCWNEIVLDKRRDMYKD